MTDKQQSSQPHTGAARPKPGPRPGPGAMPKKVKPTPGMKAQAPVAVHPVKSTPADFGRIDADGAVWLRREGHEDRVVGQWQAGTLEEGLKHFGAKFDDLATQVATLETRLSAQPEQAAAIKASATDLLDGLDHAEVVGDLNALQTKLEALLRDCDKAQQDVAQAKAERKDRALRGKRALAEEAEKLGESSTEWKATGDRFRTMVDEWRGFRGLDQKTDDELWERFSRAREQFNKRRGAHFADLDKQREVARRKKEELIVAAEELQHSTRWAETSAAYRDLMDQWKAAGHAPRKVDDELWERFRAAREVFFNARKADQEARDEEFEENATKKQQLLDEYSSLIDPKAHLGNAQRLLRELQEKWDEIGFVPRAKIREFEDKIGAIEKRVTDAVEEKWRQTDPELQARVDQFFAKAKDLQQQANEAKEAAKDKLAAKLQEQADQWRQWAETAQASTKSESDSESEEN